MTDMFNPRNMVSPPFIVCPACSKDEFGVHIIGADEYMRRCRDCWYKEFIPLPTIKKKIIYLDQFVVSNLMKLDKPEFQRSDQLTNENFWKSLRHLLFQLREMQLICCPNSGSHEVESRISPFNDELKKTYEALSGGIKFKPFESIETAQIRELALAWAEDREPQFDFSPKRIFTKDPNEWAERFYVVFGNNPFVIPGELQQSRDQMQSHITHLFQNVWAKEHKTFKYWYDLERKAYQGILRKAFIESREDRIHSMIAFKPGSEASLEHLGKILPSHAEALHEGLKHIMRFPRVGGERTLEERDNLEKSFGDANRLSEAPFVTLQAPMYASLAIRAGGGQKMLPNEGTDTDIQTVAHLLPYCDAMLMDNGCRSMLLNIPLDLRPADVTKVYSPKVKDEFLSYLRTILKGATAEHLATLREVYGDDSFIEPTAATAPSSL